MNDTIITHTIQQEDSDKWRSGTLISIKWRKKNTFAHNKQKTDVKAIQARWKNNKNQFTVLQPLQLLSLTAVNVICYYVLLFRIIHFLCQST